MKQEALEVLKNRRAIRAYKSQQITDEELNAVLEAGTYAPTGMGTQGVQIVAVQSPEAVAAVTTGRTGGRTERWGGRMDCSKPRGESEKP